MTQTQTSPETKVVQVTLAGETRSILIERLSPAHTWHANDPKGAVLCRFRTGTKVHLSRCPQVFDGDKSGRPGKWFFSHVTINNRHASVVAWADAVAPAQAGSGWTGTL